MQMEVIFCEVEGQIYRVFHEMFRIVGDNVLGLWDKNFM